MKASNATNAINWAAVNGKEKNVGCQKGASKGHKGMNEKERGNSGHWNT
jgi:hypothetical protein